MQGRMVICSAIVAVTLGACVDAGSGGSERWERPSYATQQDFNRDNFQCVRFSEVQYQGWLGMMMAQGEADKRYKNCMKSKGYKLGRVPK